MDGILASVKDYLGIHADNDAFDSEILQAINSIWFVLYQLGVTINDETATIDENSTWDEFIVPERIGITRQYVSMRVRMQFDPPTNTYVMEALRSQIDELEWRVTVESDKEDYQGEEG